MTVAPEGRSIPIAEVKPTLIRESFQGIRDILANQGGKRINDLKGSDISGQDKRSLLSDLGYLAVQDTQKNLTPEQKSALKKFRTEYQTFIKENLREPLLEAITAHLYNEPADNSRQKRILETSKALAKTLGLEKDPEVAALLFDEDSKNRRRLLGFAVGLPIGVAGGVGLVTVAGRYGLLDGILSRITPKPNTSSEKPALPTPQTKPQTSASPPPSPVASPAAQTLDQQPRSTEPVVRTEPAKPAPAETKPADNNSNPEISQAATQSPVREPFKERKEALPPRQDKWGFVVNTPEAIEALPPSVGVIRIDGDSNLMYPDGHFHHNPDHYYEDMLNAADRKGLKVVFVYKASWFPGIDERKLQDGDLEKTAPIIKSHMRAILKHPSVTHFEVCNEIDQNIKVFGQDDQFWEGSMEDYVKLFKIVQDQLPEIQAETGSNAELIISSFADPMGTQTPGRAEEYFSQLVKAFKENGVDPSQYLVAGHAYHLETLQWIFDNLAQKVGAKGVIITEYNIKDKDQKAREELARMVQMIEGQPGVTAIAHVYKPESRRPDPYAISQSDPRFPIIMEAVGREMARDKNLPFAKVVEPEAEPEPITKEGRIYEPPELTPEEFREWEVRHKNAFDSVLTEALFTKELGPMTKEKRQQTIDAIAMAHAKAIVKHYGDTDAIIGLDPGHGVDEKGYGDVGSSVATRDEGTLPEWKLTWKIAQLTAKYIMELSNNKYNVIITRPEHPQIRDLNGDRSVENYDNIRQRKLSLAKEVAELRPDPEDRQRDILYCSIHLNGSPDGSQTGTEVYYPHEVGVPDPEKRQSSKAVAEKIQDQILEELKAIGHPIRDRRAIADSGAKSYVALLA